MRTFEVCLGDEQWLNSQEARALDEARLAALSCYCKLSDEANTACPPINRWPVQPKHHMFDHVCREASATGLRPHAALARQPLRFHRES